MSHCRILVVVWLLVAAASPQPASSQTFAEKIQKYVPRIAKQPARKLKVILVGDTLAEDLAAAKDVIAVEKLITDSFRPEEYGRIEKLVGNRARKQPLLDLIGSIEPDQGTAILVYISSHGNYQKEGTHNLELGMDDVSRQEILDAIRARRPLVGFLITDACANKSPLDFQKMINVKNWVEGNKLLERLKNKSDLPTNSKIVRYLLLQHRGIVDINACSPNQRALTDVDRGGFFTHALVLAACHDQNGMAPPPPRGRVPSVLENKTEGREFMMTLQRVDRNDDKNIDWREFSGSLLTNYLAIFHGSANQVPWIISLNDDLTIERNAPEGVQVYVGVAEATENGLNGEQKIGVGRTILIGPNENVAKKFIEDEFPFRKDIASAASVDAATDVMKKAFGESHPTAKVVAGSLKVSVRLKFGPPPSPPVGIPPQPGRANINNREYLDWLEKYYPAEFKKLYDRYGAQIRKTRGQ